MTQNTYSLPVMETVKTAWAKVSGAKGSFWAILGIAILAQFIAGFLADLGPKGGALDIIFSIIGSIIQIMAGASLVYLGVRRAQDIPITWKMVKDILTGRIILYLIGLYILQILIFVPAGLLAGIGVWFLHMQPEPSIALQLLAGLCFVASAILFIFLALRMWLAAAVVVDKKSGPLEALRLSFRATCGNIGKLIGLYFVNVLIALVCAITLGIGFIWGFPLLLILYGEAYKRLSTRQDIRTG